MDYPAIYQDFISNRRANESRLVNSGAYFEKHHIRPRSLGGNDLSKNIIRLTPEDHYFAHLLLAKIHGGKMWAAARAMCILPVDGRRLEIFKSRAMFGHARRKAAAYYSDNFSGLNNPSTDTATHTFKNLDGRKVVGLRSEIMRQCGLTNRAVSSLILGQKRTYNGWYDVKQNPKGTKGVDWEDAKIVCRKINKLFHHDGREWQGTKRDFQKEFGKKLYFQPGSLHCYGWYRSKHDAMLHHERLAKKCKANSKARGDISGAKNPRADAKIYAFENEKTGQVVKKTRVQMAEDYGIKSSSITGVIKGHQVAAKGWKLQGTTRKRAPIGGAGTSNG